MSLKMNRSRFAADARLKTPKSLPFTRIAEPRLTSTRECTTLDAMSRARRLRLPLDGRPVTHSLALCRQALAPVDKSAGGGRSHQCRGSSGRSVRSRPGGAFKTSRLAGGCRWLPVLSGAGSRLRVLGVSPVVLSKSVFSQHPAPRGERCRSGVCEHFVHFGRDRRPRPADGACPR